MNRRRKVLKIFLKLPTLALTSSGDKGISQQLLAPLFTNDIITHYNYVDEKMFYSVWF